MSCELFELKELALVSLEIRDVLRCILHTILFHRALGLVRPKDVDCRRFDITYVQCGDAEVEKKIDEKIDQFISWVEKHPNRKSQVTLSFYEVRNKHPTWFSNKTERLYWEQWHINLHITNPKTHGKSHNNTKASEDNGENAEETSFRHAALESSLREVLFQVINLANNKGDHIPSVTNSDVVSFPYEITLPRLNLLKELHIFGSSGDLFLQRVDSSSDSSFGGMVISL